MLPVLVMVMAMVMALVVQISQVLVVKWMNPLRLLRNLKVMAMAMFVSNVVKVPMVKALAQVAMLLLVKSITNNSQRKRGLMLQPIVDNGSDTEEAKSSSKH